jgi:predicted Zn finger-like uncharacterized protein
VKVSCPSCAAKYSIADEKVRNRLAKIRCRKCETTIVIDGKTDPPTIQAADAAGGRGDDYGRGDEYTVDISDNDQRQMTVQQLVTAYNESLVNAETYVWKEGMADWEQLANVPELNDALHRAAAEAAASVAPAVSVPPSASFSTATASPTHDLFGGAPAVSHQMPRAATRGGGADLFGGIDRAGSETDLATSAHDPAPVQPATGARNESSVLFSLSALTGSERAKPASLPHRDAADDSGLIDLGALAAKSDAGAADVIAASPLGMAGVSPLGAPLIGGSTAPLGVDGTPVRAAGSRNGLYIGAGIAFASLVAGAVFLLKEPPPPAPGIIAIATAIPTAPAEVADPDQNKDKPEEEAKADTEKEDEAKKETTAKSTTGGTRRYTPKASPKPDSKPSEAKTESKTEAKTEKPAEKPKKSNCNCKPGDLMCAMKCSAKK